MRLRVVAIVGCPHARLVRQSLQLPAINEGLEDILLDIEVVVVDGRERCQQRRSELSPIFGDGPKDQAAAVWD
jgi:hypothetical protein